MYVCEGDYDVTLEVEAPVFAAPACAPPLDHVPVVPASRGRRKGNERAEIRITTKENHENQEREKRNK